MKEVIARSVNFVLLVIQEKFECGIEHWLVAGSLAR